jgi:hypothetical protein
MLSDTPLRGGKNEEEINSRQLNIGISSFLPYHDPLSAFHLLMTLNNLAGR